MGAVQGGLRPRGDIPVTDRAEIKRVRPHAIDAFPRRCCGPADLMESTLKPTQKPTQAPTVAAAKKKYVHSNSRSGLQVFFALVLIMVIIISIMAICARCKKDQRSNQRSLEMSERQSSYEPPVVVQGERVPAPMGRVPPSKLDSPRGAVV